MINAVLAGLFKIASAPVTWISRLWFDDSRNSGNIVVIGL